MQNIFKINFFFSIIFISKKWIIKSNKNESERDFFLQNNMKEIVNEPILPINTKDFAIKKYHISKYNLSHPRYHFQHEYNKRKVFKINYSYYPYLMLSKKISYQENAMHIYDSTGMLNITKFEYYYLKNYNDINAFDFNQIHVTMAFGKIYSDISLVSIASILNASSSETYIHFHILALDFTFDEIKKIIDLRKINNKVDFVFYNAKQVEYDFEMAKNDRRGFGNLAKILSPQIINNTNKVIILDSGDIIAQKDLSEVFFYDIGDNYFGWMLEVCAGYYIKYDDKFMTNNFHPNAGVVLVNIRLFRQDELYKKAVFVAKSYHSFECPVQEILITITNYKFAYIPLNFNVNLYYEHGDDVINRRNITSIWSWLNYQRFSPHKYEFDEFVDAMTDPVVNHYYIGKMQEIKRCNKQLLQWLKYVNLTGRYNEIKEKYPDTFECETIFGLN